MKKKAKGSTEAPIRNCKAWTFSGRVIDYNWGRAGIKLLMLKVAVMIPVIRKIITAPNDLSESLGRPQSPWPLVQPEANWVPNPTRNPARIR